MATVIPQPGNITISQAVIAVNADGTPVGVAPAASPSAVVGNVAAGATDSGNPVKVGGKYSATLPTLVDGQRGDLVQGSRGSLNVSLFQANSSNTPAMPAAGADGLTNASISLLVTAFGSKFNGTSWDRDRKPNGASRILSAAASTNATVAKASAGDAVRAIGVSARGSICYLKIYNKATAPTVGTDTPILTIPIPANVAFDIDLGGFYFSTGISYAFTTAAADADTGALTAADILGFNLLYA